MNLSKEQQCEIERDERWLGSFGSPAPPAELIAAVKQAACLELGERWLTSLPQLAVPPDAGLTKHIKAAVRTELAGAWGRSVRPRSWIRGMLAAAAGLILAAGVAQFAATHLPPRTRAARIDPVEDFVDGLAAVLADQDPELRSIENDVALIEAGFFPDGQRTRRAFDAQLEGLMQQLDELFTEPDYPAEAS